MAVGRRGSYRHRNGARPDPRLRRAAHRAGAATGTRADRYRCGHGHHRAVRGTGGIRRPAGPRGHHPDDRPPRRAGGSGGVRLGAPRSGRRGQRRRRGHLRYLAGLAGSGERDPRPGVADAGLPRPRPRAAGDPARPARRRGHGHRGRARRDRDVAPAAAHRSGPDARRRPARDHHFGRRAGAQPDGPALAGRARRAEHGGPGPGRHDLRAQPGRPQPRSGRIHQL